MAMKFKIETNINETIGRALAQNASKGENDLAKEILKDTERYTPMLNGSLDKRTHVRGRAIIYPGPYARYLYYGKVMVRADTGQGPSHYVDKNGNEVVKNRKGYKMMATNKNLVFTKAHHPEAQAHWFEASKAQNLDKWTQVAAAAMTGKEK